MLDDFEEEDDEEMDGVEIEAQEELEPIALGTWQDATDEVDAYLMESDSELDEGEDSTNDVILGEGESEAGSVPGTPKSRRLTPHSGPGIKRRRSVTPSGQATKQLELSEKELDELNLRSPLAKRKKLADQRGSSGLRQEVDIPDNQDKSTKETVETVSLTVPGKDSSEGYVSEYDDVASSISSDEDFLAAELEAEMA